MPLLLRPHAFFEKNRKNGKKLHFHWRNSLTLYTALFLSSAVRLSLFALFPSLFLRTVTNRMKQGQVILSYKVQRKFFFRFFLHSLSLFLPLSLSLSPTPLLIRGDAVDRPSDPPRELQVLGH